MVAPRDYFQDDQEASGILKIINPWLHLELVYYSRSTTHFMSLALEINDVLVYLVKKIHVEGKKWLVRGPFKPIGLIGMAPSWPPLEE